MNCERLVFPTPIVDLRAVCVCFAYPLHENVPYLAFSRSLFRDTLGPAIINGGAICNTQKYSISCVSMQNQVN